MTTIRGPTLAERTASLLVSVTALAVEVGPGHSDLPRTSENPPGGGPLAGVAAGWEHLGGLGWAGPALIVATDLPLLTREALEWLADHPADESVVPVVGGREQSLCARYSKRDLDIAVALAHLGFRAMSDLIGAIEPWRPPEEDWMRSVFGDVDTPADLTRLLEGGA